MRVKDIETRQFRCKQILTLHSKGLKQTAIAEALACSQAWVSKVLNSKHESALPNKNLGKKPALNTENLLKLAELLDQGAICAGFSTDNWTRKRVTEIIYLQFDIKHDPSHVSRILAKIGYTIQKPRRSDYRQDSDSVQHWLKETLPKLKKKHGKKVT